MSHFFDHILGNDKVKDYLVRMVSKQAIANSLLFAGPEGVGKSLFARGFANLLLSTSSPGHDHAQKIELGNHLNVREYYPEGKIGMHSIDSMRALIEEINTPPHESPWKIFIIHNADRMLTYSANALLKTFEEPPPKSIIILLSSAPESLLPTVLSRCRTIWFHLIPNDIVASFVENKWSKTPQEAQEIALRAMGSIGHASLLAGQESDALRALVLNLLITGKKVSYPQLLDDIEKISQMVTKQKMQLEEEVRASLALTYCKEMSKIQQEVVNKEVDGALAIHLSSQAHTIFEIILGWYRDLHLLKVGANKNYLMHPDYYEHSYNAMQQGEILPLETLQKIIATQTLALERSTSLEICLESLFLSLDSSRSRS